MVKAPPPGQSAWQSSRYPRHVLCTDRRHLRKRTKNVKVHLLAGRYPLLDHELALQRLMPACEAKNVDIVVDGHTLPAFRSRRFYGISVRRSGDRWTCQELLIAKGAVRLYPFIFALSQPKLGADLQLLSAKARIAQLVTTRNCAPDFTRVYINGVVSDDDTTPSRCCR
jgi:hypothetical protein